MDQSAIFSDMFGAVSRSSTQRKLVITKNHRTKLYSFGSASGTKFIVWRKGCAKMAEAFQKKLLLSLQASFWLAPHTWFFASPLWETCTLAQWFSLNDQYFGMFLWTRSTRIRQFFCWQIPQWIETLPNSAISLTAGKKNPSPQTFFFFSHLVEQTWKKRAFSRAKICEEHLETCQFHPFFLKMVTYTTWVFPKIGVGPPNHPFVHRVFHYFHHPFWGNPPYFWKHPLLPWKCVSLSIDICGHRARESPEICWGITIGRRPWS